MESELIAELGEITDIMYRHGWNECNGGNISCILDEGDLGNYDDLGEARRTIEMKFPIPAAEGMVFLVTGTGKCFKNIRKSPQVNTGVVKVIDGGQQLEVLWGFETGAAPTSEFPTHVMNHLARLKVDPEHRVVMHCHPVNTIAMTFVHELDEKQFSLSLWQTITECILIFGDGVGVVPWMSAGTDEIARETAKRLNNCRTVIWGQHGIFAAERNLEEAFGLIETVEKGAEIYMKTFGLPIINSISKQQLQEVAEVYGVTPRKGYFD